VLRSSESEAETLALAAKLAGALFKKRPSFVQLTGPLGAGKTLFARGFIASWLTLAQDKIEEAVTSPSYNLVKVYGSKQPLAHLDLYRLKSMSELENIGFEHYFFEYPCCLVEWLEQIPEALNARPADAASVTIAFGNTPQQRLFKIEGLSESSLEP
jgi:tRNA threonylcarbamoyl adenosine modification protein YjeE